MWRHVSTSSLSLAKCGSRTPGLATRPAATVDGMRNQDLQELQGLGMLKDVTVQNLIQHLLVT